jgi:hypothetical protein
VSLHDPRNYEQRLLRYMQDHSLAAQISLGRGKEHGHENDLKWGRFLTKVATMAATELVLERTGNKEIGNSGRTG